MMDFRFLSPRKVYLLSVGFCAVLAFSVWGTSPAMADTFVVNELGDDSDPSPGNGICGTMDFFGNHCTLRAAIEEANALEGAHEILLDPPLSGTITLTSNFPNVDVDVAVRGVAADRVAIDGASSYRPFYVSAGVVLTLSDLTVQHAAVAVDTPKGHVVVERCRFLNNSSTGNGGVIRVSGSTVNAPTLVVKDSIFTGNTANANGGAIYSYYGETHLENVTVVGNSANGEGGGAFFFQIGYHGTSTLTHLTVTGNTSDAENNGYGKGGGFVGSFADGGVFIADSVIAGNTSLGDSFNDCYIYGTITSVGNNLVGDETGCQKINAPTDVKGTPASPIDPKLGALALNLGFTEIQLPAADSPLVDSGGPATCSDHDQQGIPRPQDGGAGAVCDIGAAERSHCDNGGWDEDERDTDCGGSICAACTCANPTDRILRIQPGAQAGVVYGNFYDILMYQVADGDILKVREDVYPDYVNFDTGGTTTLAVSLEGGYDCNKTPGSNDGYFSKIKGSLTVGAHFAVTVSNIVIM